MTRIHKWLDEQESDSSVLTEQRMLRYDSLQNQFKYYDSIGTNLRKRYDSLEIELRKH